jgi:hypothetical protein
VKILEKLRAKTAPLLRLIVALSEQRCLLGPSTGDILRAVEKIQERRRRQEAIDSTK